MSADPETAANWVERLRSQLESIRQDQARLERIVDAALATAIGGIPVLIITLIVNSVWLKWTLFVLLLPVVGLVLLRGRIHGIREGLSELLRSWADVRSRRVDSRPPEEPPAQEFPDLTSPASSTRKPRLVLALGVAAALTGGFVLGLLVAGPDVEPQKGEETQGDEELGSVAIPTPSQSSPAATPSDDDGGHAGGEVAPGTDAGDDKRTQAFRSPTQEELDRILLTEKGDLRDFAGPVGLLTPDPIRGPLFEMVQAGEELCPAVSISPPPAIEDAVHVFENYYDSFIGNEATSFGTVEEAKDLMNDLERAAAACGFRVRSSRPVLGEATLRFVDDRRPYRDYVFYRVRVVVVQIVTKATWDNHSSIADQLAEITEVRAERLRFKPLN